MIVKHKFQVSAHQPAGRAFVGSNSTGKLAKSFQESNGAAQTVEVEVDLGALALYLGRKAIKDGLAREVNGLVKVRHLRKRDESVR